MSVSCINIDRNVVRVSATTCDDWITPLRPSNDGLSNAGISVRVAAESWEILLTPVSVRSEPSDSKLVDLPRVRDLGVSLSGSMSMADNERAFTDDCSTGSDRLWAPKSGMFRTLDDFRVKKSL